MGLLTNYCTATPPALASFEIIARRKRLGGCIGFLLPVKAREGRVNRGVSPLPRNISYCTVAVPSSAILLTKK